MDIYGTVEFRYLKWPVTLDKLARVGYPKLSLSSRVNSFRKLIPTIPNQSDTSKLTQNADDIGQLSSRSATIAVTFRSSSVPNSSEFIKIFSLGPSSGLNMSQLV